MVEIDLLIFFSSSRFLGLLLPLVWGSKHWKNATNAQNRKHYYTYTMVVGTSVHTGNIVLCAGTHTQCSYYLEKCIYRVDKWIFCTCMFVRGNKRVPTFRLCILYVPIKCTATHPMYP